MSNARRHLLIALMVALVGSLFLPLARMELRPWHEAGHAQVLLSIANGVAGILHLPCAVARWQTIALIGQHEAWLANHLPAAITTCLPYVAYLGANFVLCFSIGLVASACFAPRAKSMRENVTQTASTLQLLSEQRVPFVSRRQLLQRAAQGVALAGASTLGYGFVFRPNWWIVTRHQVSLRGLPAHLNGLRVVQLTDIHLGPWLSTQHVRSIVEATNALRPDLVVLTGDYVYESPSYVPQVAKVLGELKPKIGCLGVLGNHDWWEDADLARRELQLAGIPLIDNDRVVLTSSRKLERNADEGLCIAGVGDFWEDRQLYGQALGGLAPTTPRILLSHNPDIAEAEELAAGAFRVDLMLCGHTHGGQIQLPLVPNPAAGVSRYGAKYTHGLVQGPVAPVYTSAGLGTVGIPIRLGTSPEIAVFELRSA